MSLVVQVIVTGLAAGGVYGLVAVGHSLIYRLTGIVYFAFGDLVAFAVFATLLVAAGTAPVSRTSLAPGRFLLALAIGLVFCSAVGAATYVLFIEPYLLRGSTLGWVASTLAIAFALRGMIGATFTRPAYVFPDPIPFDKVGRDGVVSLAGASVQVRSFFVIALAALLQPLRPGRSNARGTAAPCRRSPRTSRELASSASRSRRSSPLRSGSSARWPQ